MNLRRNVEVSPLSASDHKAHAVSHPIPLVQLLSRHIQRLLIDPFPSERLDDLSLCEEPRVDFALSEGGESERTRPEESAVTGNER